MRLSTGCAAVKDCIATRTLPNFLNATVGRMAKRLLHLRPKTGGLVLFTPMRMTPRDFLAPAR